MNTITERLLTFEIAGEVTTYNAVKIANLFIENDIDYICYLKDYRPKFYVRRSGKKWNDIYKLINSVQAFVYRFTKETFYITNEKKDGILGNIQRVCEIIIK
jgi:hypothetical protein